MLSYFSSQAGADEVATVLNAEGVAIVEHLISSEMVAHIRSELEPRLPSPFLGQDAFTGFKTRRIGGLTVKSPTFAGLLTHPLMLGVCDRICNRTAPSTSSPLRRPSRLARGSRPKRSIGMTSFIPFPSPTPSSRCSSY